MVSPAGAGKRKKVGAGSTVTLAELVRYPLILAAAQAVPPAHNKTR